MQMPGHLAAIRSGRGAPSGDAWALVWAEAQQQQHGQELPAALKQLESVWRDCSGGIYLDFGSNLGVQIRKVYSPQQFPGAPVLEVFDRVFGSNRSRVCALGAEPNPAHRPYLNTLNAHFRRKGFQALVLTDTAVSTHAGEATLHLDAGSPAQWGASLTAGPWHRHTNASARTATVQLLDLPRVLADVVLPFVRRTQLARGGARPPVVMKLDVEGAEYALLPALMLNGALCSMQAVYYESHPQAMRSADAVNMTFPAMLAAFAQLRTSSPRCGVKLLALDDESFLHGDRVPLVRLR